MAGEGRFRDRRHAGELLADATAATVGAAPSVVFGIPRGGVVVAAPVARALDAPLDVVVTRKVGVPGNPELGMGAVAPGSVRILDDVLIRRLGIPPSLVDAQVAQAEREVERRLRAYRGDRPPVDPSGATAVIVDDGIATGGTALAAVTWAVRAGAARVVLAAPVAPREAVGELRARVDDLVILWTPSPFFAVGQWYERFDQLRDEEVRAALAVTG